MTDRIRTTSRRLKRRVRRHRGVLHRRLRRRAPSVSQAMVRSADRARALRFRYLPVQPHRPVEQVLQAYAAEVPRADFIQVGAHDGTKLDPLRPIVLAGGWRGVMVEPVPYVFARLHERYGANPRMRLENVAVAEEAGHQEFFYVAESEGTLWHSYDALGSFRRDIVVSHTHLIPDIESRVVSEPVECVTFDDLCARNGLDTVNMIQIDTEGFDLHILRMIDLDARRPDIVVFEHLHMTRDERDEAAGRFAAAGYRQVSDGMDTLALSPAAQAMPSVATVFDRAQDELREFDQ